MRSPSASTSATSSRLCRYFVQAILLTLGATVTAHASGPSPFPPEGSFDHTVVHDHAFERASGRIAVNAAAGDGNSQSNAAALAVGSKQTEARVRQALAPHPDIVTGDVEAHIGGRAFQHATGLISINQVAGSGNAQANAVAIGLGADTVVSIETLGAISAAPDGGRPATLDDDHHQQADIAGSAFQSARGVVQVNQVAGSGNATSNRFSMQVHRP